MKQLKRVLSNIEKGEPSFKGIVISEQEKLGIISIFYIFTKLLQESSIKGEMNALNGILRQMNENKRVENAKKKNINDTSNTG